MSEGIKRPYLQVYTVACALKAALSPACHRIEIAGSVRREKEFCSDIELVAIPRLHTNLLGDPLETSQVDDALGRWPVTLHKNGNKFKQFSIEWQPSMWFKVDLFLQPDPATWGYNFTIRTGSPDFSKRLVTAKAYGGLKPDDLTIKDARVWRNGALVDTPEERDIFSVFGLAWIEPRDRH